MTQRLVCRHRAFPTAGRVGIHRRTSPWRAGALCHPDQPQWTSDRPTVPSSRQAPKRPPAAIAHLTLLVRVPGRPDLIQAFTAAEQVRSREWRWVTRPEVRRPLRPARGHQLSRTDTLLSARTGGLATNRATVRRFRWRTDYPRRFAISGPAGLPPRWHRRRPRPRRIGSRATPHIRDRARQRRHQRLHIDEASRPRIHGHVPALCHCRTNRNPHSCSSEQPLQTAQKDERDLA
jgi:hypothetical protein